MNAAFQQHQTPNIHNNHSGLLPPPNTMAAKENRQNKIHSKAKQILSSNNDQQIDGLGDAVDNTSYSRRLSYDENRDSVPTV